MVRAVAAAVIVAVVTVVGLTIVPLFVTLPTALVAVMVALARIRRADVMAE